MGLTVSDSIRSTNAMQVTPPPPPREQAASAVQPGDGSFSGQVAGTQAKPDIDLQLAEMSNDAYSTGIDRPADAQQSINDLASAGWTRLGPNEDGTKIVGADGKDTGFTPAQLNDPSSGFGAAIFQNPQGQYVVAFAGTDVKQFGDLSADATQAFGIDTKQYNQATALAKDAELAFGDGNVVFTGHSLGGGLASAASLATGASSVTFNSAGLSNGTLHAMGFNANATRESVADSGQVRRYVTDGDPLSFAQQDIPAIPIPVSGVPVPLSPPDALGHELRIALPDGVTPLSLAAHGGSGDNTSYVDALKQNTAYEPAPHGFTFNTIANAGETVMNQLGSAANLVKGDVTAIIDTGKNLYGDAKATVQQDYGNGRYVDGTISVLGDVANNGLDLAGKGLSNSVSFAGDTVQNVTDAGGQLLRDAANDTIFEKPVDAVASVIEGGGNLFAKGSDLLGKGFEWLGDKGGDIVRLGVDGVANVAQAAVDAGQWAGGKVVDGAKAIGNAFVGGAKTVAGWFS